MPRRRHPPQTQSPFEEFFDRILDQVVERVDRTITPLIEELAEVVADTVQHQVDRQAGVPKPLRKPRRSTRTQAPHPPPTSHTSSKRRESTLYDVLEVSPKASMETIKVAYRSLSTRNHPDRNPGNDKTAARMREINAAWEVLGDEGKRAAYDRSIHV